MWENTIISTIDVSHKKEIEYVVIIISYEFLQFFI